LEHPEEFVFVECGHSFSSFAEKPLLQFLWSWTH
jgi:hypothetical protein